MDELDRLIAEQGVKSVKDPTTLLGGWPEDKDFDDFMVYLKHEREVTGSD